VRHHSQMVAADSTLSLNFFTASLDVAGQPNGGPPETRYSHTQSLRHTLKFSMAV